MIDECIQTHGKQAEKTDAHEEPIHFEHLTGINNQIPQPFFRSKKFPNDHPDQTQSDIYLHIADDRRNRTWKHNFSQYLMPFPAKCIDQRHLSRIRGHKTGIQIQDASEDSHRHTGNNDGGTCGTEPYDEKRGQGGFWQTV